MITGCKDWFVESATFVACGSIVVVADDAFGIVQVTKGDYAKLAEKFGRHSEETGVIFLWDR